MEKYQREIDSAIGFILGILFSIVIFITSTAGYVVVSSAR